MRAGKKLAFVWPRARFTDLPGLNELPLIQALASGIRLGKYQGVQKELLFAQFLGIRIRGTLFCARTFLFFR